MENGKVIGYAFAVIGTIYMIEAMWRKYLVGGITSALFLYLILGALLGCGLICKIFMGGDKLNFAQMLRLVFKMMFVWLFALWIPKIRDWVWSDVK